MFYVYIYERLIPLIIYIYTYIHVSTNSKHFSLHEPFIYDLLFVLNRVYFEIALICFKITKYYSTDLIKKKYSPCMQYL